MPDQNSLNYEVIDEIIKEFADGYGDLMAAASIHNVNVKVLQARVREVQGLGLYGFHR